jgi:hypothetical protein
MEAAAVEVERAGNAARSRFVATIFAGSFLLFLVQPMVARMALPRLGGAPAVWNSAMLVYQALLLAGYAYAHWLGRAAPRRQAAIHLAVFAVAALTLPIGLIAAFPPPDANPFLWVPWLLLLSIGPLFFVISAQAPLIQRWYSLAGAGDPYPLYAASNLGSFAGLIAYPLLVEPLLPIVQQRWWWSGAYCLLALLVAWCAFSLPAKGVAEATVLPREAPPSWRERFAWILLAAVPSGLILSTTLHVTTDIGAMPLLWVLPLGVYLLSFTLAFAANRRLAEAIARTAPLILLFAACGLFVEVKSFALLFGVVAIVNLFTASVALHKQLFERRPGPQHLTLFYLMMSVGGVLGGIFGALVAPMVFDWTYEHVILLVAAAYLMKTPGLFDRFARLWNGDLMARRLTWAGALLVVALAVAGKGIFGLPASQDLSYYAGFAIIAVAILAIGNRLLFTVSVAALMVCVGGWERLGLSAEPGKMTRSFFGVYSLHDRPGRRSLAHGTTLHGVQNLGSPERERMATTYYAPQSGVGLAMAAAPRLFGDQARIGIVGLGAGTLACYAQPGQSWTFYEIDPVDIAIARDPKRFTFLSRCLPGVPVELGDARLTLERAPPRSADLLVIDAFSSDSIPIHLLTSEAFAVYRRHLSERGLLLVHISNRFLDLKPVIAAAAAQGWNARLRHYRPGEQQKADNHTSSMWIAMSPSKATLEQMVSGGEANWQAIRPRTGFAPWTDDHATLLPLIRWRN